MVEIFCQHDLVGVLRDVLASADASVEIMPLSHAEYLLNNWGESHSVIAAKFDKNEYLAWLHYSQDHCSLSLICAFPEAKMLDFRNMLDEAFFRRFPILVSAFGNFSAISNNPYSQQPTLGEFEAGQPCLTGPVKIEILAEGLS